MYKLSLIFILSFFHSLLFFKAFDESIQKICDTLTSCTLQLYKSIIKDLPPTPSKFHYIFNLRDLSRVYNGLTLTNAERFCFVPHSF